jgi:serine/threonine protein kinase
MALTPGAILQGRYRIASLLSQGGYGAVYRAWDLNLNRPCAVKENLEAGPDAQRQFLREATILSGLDHPNLVRVLDHFIVSGQGQYLVMSFVEGADLGTVVQRGGPVRLEQALYWFHQVCAALQYLHTHNPPVIHRDVKPANLRITPDGRVVLVDFGLAKFYSAQSTTTTSARGITPGYSPIEQYGHGSTDERSDVYALGATLYTLLTAQIAPESVQRATGQTLTPAHLLNPQVPEPVGLAIERAMALDPTQRFANIAEFESAIASIDLAPHTAPENPRANLWGPSWAVAVLFAILALIGALALAGGCWLVLRFVHIAP